MKSTAIITALALISVASAQHSKLKTSPVVDLAGLQQEDAKVHPSVAEYKVKAGLLGIANLGQFKGLLDATDKAMIAKNLFVVRPTQYDQMFNVYENNEYARPLKLPAFITTDAMLHEYHIFYDYSLRTVEEEKLYRACKKLTNLMLGAAKNDYAQAKNKNVRSAALHNIAYFKVAKALLSGSKASGNDNSSAWAVHDLKAATEHERVQACASISNQPVDFSQFVPRGHYTRSVTLKRYFMGMMWYGNAGLPVESGTATLQALLISNDLRRTPGAVELWQSIYEPTAFYVGKDDDISALQFNWIASKTFGKNPPVDSFATKSSFVNFTDEARKLPKPKIPLAPPFDGLRFHFMGQRFIPDSRILQQLTGPIVKFRSRPWGLDVFAALGSDRALTHLTNYCHINGYPQYPVQMQKMRAEMETTPQATWTSNLYWGWLWSLQSLAKPAPKGYPSFMRGDAWLDKCLYTGLASWTELRHDTILYSKQSVSAECGGGGEVKEPPLPKGYVEPSLEVWTKLLSLNAMTKAGLAKRHLLTAELSDSFDRIGDWLSFCRRITIKELTGAKVTRDEYQQMTTFGGDLSYLHERFMGSLGYVISDADKHMALIADVHTDGDNKLVLEEGEGNAGVIYAVVPIEGKLYLTRGATYTQYEFTQPMSKRLTDEEWQKMLEKNKVPPAAPWVKGFMNLTKQLLPLEFSRSTGGC